jgi:hypothetical protein
MLRGMFNGGVAVFLYDVVALVLLLEGEDEVVRPLGCMCLYFYSTFPHMSISAHLLRLRKCSFEVTRKVENIFAYCQQVLI